MSNMMDQAVADEAATQDVWDYCEFHNLPLRHAGDDCAMCARIEEAEVTREEGQQRLDRMEALVRTMDELLGWKVPQATQLTRVDVLAIRYHLDLLVEPF